LKIISRGENIQLLPFWVFIRDQQVTPQRDFLDHQPLKFSINS
jgi:hypothetical protein